MTIQLTPMTIGAGLILGIPFGLPALAPHTRHNHTDVFGER